MTEDEALAAQTKSNWITRTNNRKECSNHVMLPCTHGDYDLLCLIKRYYEASSSFYDGICARTMLAQNNVSPLVIDNFYNVIGAEVKSTLSARA